MCAIPHLALGHITNNALSASTPHIPGAASDAQPTCGSFGHVQSHRSFWSNSWFGQSFSPQTQRGRRWGGGREGASGNDNSVHPGPAWGGSESGVIHQVSCHHEYAAYMAPTPYHHVFCFFVAVFISFYFCLPFNSAAPCFFFFFTYPTTTTTSTHLPACMHKSSMCPLPPCYPVSAVLSTLLLNWPLSCPHPPG